MSIPGVEPVSPAEESFDFVPDPNAPALKSRYEFDNGVYPGIVISFTKGVSKKGKPQYVVKALGTGGPAKGLEYTTYMQLPKDPNDTTPDTKEEMEKRARAVAITERTLENVFGLKKNDQGNFSFKSSDVMSKPVGLDLKKEEYNGKTSMKCKNLVKAPAATPVASDVPSF